MMPELSKYLYKTSAYKTINYFPYEEGGNIEFLLPSDPVGDMLGHTLFHDSLYE